MKSMKKYYRLYNIDHKTEYKPSINSESLHELIARDQYIQKIMTLYKYDNIHFIIEEYLKLLGYIIQKSKTPF